MEKTGQDNKNRQMRWILISLCAVFAAGLLFLCLKTKTGKKRVEHTIPADPAIIREDSTDGAAYFANTLDAKNSPYFTHNDYFSMTSKGSLHLIPQFRTYQQTTEYTCGCACALMVLDYFGIREYNEMQIAEACGTDETTGTSPEGLSAFFRGIGFEVDAHADTQPRFAGIEDAEAFFVESVDAGIPVMVDWVDWRGHWQVVIGIDTMGTPSPYDDVLILADPYDITDHQQDGYYIFPLGRFFDMWREGACAQKDVPYEQVFVKAWK